MRVIRRIHPRSKSRRRLPRWSREAPCHRSLQDRGTRSEDDPMAERLRSRPPSQHRRGQVRSHHIPKPQFGSIQKHEQGQPPSAQKRTAWEAKRTSDRCPKPRSFSIDDGYPAIPTSATRLKPAAFLTVGESVALPNETISKGLGGRQVASPLSEECDGHVTVVADDLRLGQLVARQGNLQAVQRACRLH
jgi:hypothetical protein